MEPPGSLHAGIPISAENRIAERSLTRYISK